MNQHEVLRTQRFDRPGFIQVVGQGATADFLLTELKLLGHTLTFTPEDSQALCSAQRLKPDMIILCLDALGARGFDLCRQYKSDFELKETPVVLLSATDDALEQLCAFESGANDVLLCPKNRNVLGARIRVLLKYRNAVRELRESQVHLEERVKERTLELEASNRELKIEMQERLRSEEALRSSQESLIQFQKVQALGQLAGGVAHDFNNILFVIMGYADTLKSGLQATDKLQRAVDQILRSSDKAAALTRQLLAFGRRQVLQPRVLDLSKVLKDSESMLRRILGNHIEFQIQHVSALGRVKFDPIQIEQILLNLAVNARDAMPGGGRLKILAEDSSLCSSELVEWPQAVPGFFVKLSVIDSGCGMDKETLQRIFEPFFTTKGEGRGTGLGLATVHGIVSQSGGCIRVFSEVGKGTRFDVYFPQTSEQLSSVNLRAVENDFVTTTNKSVLVVEDDPIVRELLLRVISKAGFSVLEAGDGCEALELIHSGAKPDVLLTDVLMPEMNGAELVKKLKPEYPDLPVIYMSAHSNEVLGALDNSRDDNQFLQKPFIGRAVVRKIREVLAS